MPKERDPFRKYVDDLKNRNWKCKFCGTKFAGSTPRIRAHLAGMPGCGIKACDKVEDPVKAEALETFNGKGSALDVSTGGTSGKGTERTVFGVSQSVLPSDDALNPNHTHNSNQLGCAPQQPSFYQPTGTGIAPACPQDQASLPPRDVSLDNLDTTQQPLDATHGKEIASSLQQLPMDLSASPSLDFTELAAFLGLPTLHEPRREQQNARGLSSFANDQVLGNSRSSGLQEFSGDGIAPYSPLYSTSLSNLHRFVSENLFESRDVIANASEELQTNELHNPTVRSSLQIDSSLEVDRANRLQDCGKSRVAEVVPVRSSTSPTDIIPHPGQLPPRCDKEHGKDIRLFPSRTPMDIDPSTALQHTSVVDLLVPKASTNIIGPSSSHALVPPQCQIVPHRSINLEIMHHNPTVRSSSSSSSWKNHPVTCHPQALMDMDPSSSQASNNAPPPPQILPRGTGLIGPPSLSELDMNEGAPMKSHPNIREELKFAASPSLKKPRMEVANWLVNVEKLGNDCLLPHKVSKLLEEKMVGEAFQRNTTMILQCLEGNKISPLGICGMGGVGKTTIMVHIHNRLLEKANYGNVIWITVSQDFNTQRLQDAIGKELGLSILQEKDVRKRATILWGGLMNKGKFTIILDDVWEGFDLKAVGIPIGVGGIKLVLTTRSFKVCREMRCQEVIKIEPLSHKEAESLFMEELGSEVVHDLEIKGVMKSIVEECAGLPLAVTTMARSMQGVIDVFEWKDCLERLRESDMRQSDMESKVLKTLEFSYSHLGDHEVQQCFLSCALYPKDEFIDKSELIEFFIDQGLIDQLDTREKQYNRGLTILNKLENVCLLEDHGSEMKMHNLIRDMALHIMSTTSIVKARKGLKTIPHEKYWTDGLEKVSLVENIIGEFPVNMSPNCPKLSIFLMNENPCYDVVKLDSFFKQLRGLKVLNLSRCGVRELPDSISDLVNLRALLLRECMNLRRIPYLRKLRSLRKLDIFHCDKVEALEGLEKLMELRYLDISYTRIKQLPKGTLGALLNLQYLNVKAINGEDITKLGALETLTCFLKDVDDFNEFARVVSKQRKPRYNKIYVHQQRLNPRVEVTGDAQFGNCQRAIWIDSWSHAIMSAGQESSGSGSGSGICILIPQDVRELVASNCDCATNLSDIGPLGDLEKLDIRSWKNLRVLCRGQDEEVIDIHNSPVPLLFPNLRILRIYQCPKLKYLFGHGIIFSLLHLRSITIYKCEEMVGITVAVRSPPPHLPPAFPSLEDIYVWECDKMKIVMESEWLPHFPNLSTLGVYDCENMEEIIRGPPPYMPVEEILPEELGVSYCDNPRNLFPHELSIEVVHCKRMVQMISGVGQDQEGSITTPVNSIPSSSQSSISLPKLNSLCLYNLPQLKSICEVPITCDSMEYLMVFKCPELKGIPLQLRFCKTKDLPFIEVEGEEKWKTLIWDHPNAQALLQPHLYFHRGRYVLHSQWSASEDVSKGESESSDANFKGV